MEDLTPELQQRLISLINYIGTSAKATADFAVDQAPLVAREVIAWGIWSNLVTAGFMLLIVIAFMYVAFKLYRRGVQIVEKGQGDPAGWFVVAVFVCVVALMMFPSVPIGVYEAIKPIVAPRVYLIEWCTDQMKQH